ncbi:uncharacterized protein DUF4229 [Flavimobilis soli]|uniref:Uncharacterized protein DUF4229 n=1 Tax=Flavimobilis soli TaxID=442709 RepID=A0A2A9EE05_9MICO|nr:DUF4229 domain-containing protein [Flavimobilis soli]PFG36505.1 uncharacterized protein DUF4229 [Flavimobilis soli]
MPVVLYSVYRLLLLAASVGLLALAGFRGWLLLLVAVVVALLASPVLLRGPRDRAALYLAERAEARRASAGKPARDEADEDAEAEG